MAQLDLKNCTFKLKDVGSNEVTVKIGEGNLTYTERQNIEYTLDRGTVDEVREGDEVPVEVRFEFVWLYLLGDTTTTIEDALKQRGGAAAWVSTDSDTCRPYAVDIEITYAPTPAACGNQETITLSDFRWEQLDHDFRAGQISCTGRCNISEASSVLAAQ